MRGNISSGLNKITKIDGIVYLSAVKLPSGCEGGVCLLVLLFKGLENAVSFDNDGNVILKGALQQNTNPQPTADEEFIFKDVLGSNIAIVNLADGNMRIKGRLYENQPTLNPNAQGNNFIVENNYNNVVSYIDDFGNFYLKGTLTENGNPK